MNDQNERTILEKPKGLPPEQVAEMENCVDFLRTRHEEQRVTQAAMKACAPAFNKIWNNSEDADYERL